MLQSYSLQDFRNENSAGAVERCVDDLQVIRYLRDYVGIDGFGDCCMAINDTFFEKIVNARIHCNHIFSSRSVDDTVNLMYFTFTDQIADRRGQYHDLKCRNHLAGYGWDEFLADNCLQNRGKLNRYLMLLRRRKGIDDTVNGAGCSDCVQRGENQMTGLCGSDSGIDRLVVTHLTKQDDVRTLA